jgi:hypothetical protein
MKDSEIAGLKKQNTELEKRLAVLESMVAEISAKR